MRIRRKTNHNKTPNKRIRERRRKTRSQIRGNKVVHIDGYAWRYSVGGMITIYDPRGRCYRTDECKVTQMDPATLEKGYRKRWFRGITPSMVKQWIVGHCMGEWVTIHQGSHSETVGVHIHWKWPYPLPKHNLNIQDYPSGGDYSQAIKEYYQQIGIQEMQPLLAFLDQHGIWHRSVDFMSRSIKARIPHELVSQLKSLDGVRCVWTDSNLTVI